MRSAFPLIHPSAGRTAWLRFSASCFAMLALGGAGIGMAAPPFAEEWPLPAPPEDVEVDPSGRVWVSCEDDTVRVFAPAGGQLLFAFGGRGMGDGEFLTPTGIAFDASGDVYICDYEGARVEKFTSEGEFVLAWPIPSIRSDHVAVDAAGDVYVTGYSNLQVHKYSGAGDPIVDWESASGQHTAGIIERDGVVSVVLWTTSDVEQFDTAGNYVRTFSAATVNGLDVEMDALGQFWVASFGGNTVNVLTPDGDLVEVLGSSGTGPGEFQGPSGIAIGPEGSVYVADQANLRVQRFGDVTAGVPLPGMESSKLSIAPNPTRSPVELVYSTSTADPVELDVLDVTGRIVATLEDPVLGKGAHDQAWDLTANDGSALPAGVYFVRLRTGAEAVTRRLVIVR